MGKVATCHRQVAGFDSQCCALLTHGRRYRFRGCGRGRGSEEVKKVEFEPHGV